MSTHSNNDDPASPSLSLMRRPHQTADSERRPRRMLVPLLCALGAVASYFAGDLAIPTSAGTGSGDARYIGAAAFALLALLALLVNRIPDGRRATPHQPPRHHAGLTPASAADGVAPAQPEALAELTHPHLRQLVDGYRLASLAAAKETRDHEAAAGLLRQDNATLHAELAGLRGGTSAEGQALHARLRGEGAAPADEALRAQVARVAELEEQLHALASERADETGALSQASDEAVRAELSRIRIAIDAVTRTTVSDLDSEQGAIVTAHTTRILEALVRLHAGTGHVDALRSTPAVRPVPQRPAITTRRVEPLPLPAPTSTTATQADGSPGKKPLFRRPRG